MAINLFSETNNEDATRETVDKSEEKISTLLLIRDELKNMSNILKTMVNIRNEEKQDARAADKEEFRKDKEDTDAEVVPDTKKESSFLDGFIKNFKKAIFGAILVLSNFVTPIIEFVKSIIPKTQEMYDNLVLKVSDGFEIVATWWQEKLITPMLDFFMETIPNIFKKITTFFGDAFQSIAWSMGDIGDGIMKWIFKTANKILKKIVSWTDGIAWVGDSVREGLGPAIEALDKKISDKQASMDARDQARADRDKLRAQEAAREAYDEEVKRKRKEEKESGRIDKSSRVPTEAQRDDKDKTKSEPAVKVTGMHDVKNMIKRHEGVRYKAYKDSLGLWTIGVGHLIGDGKSQGPYEGKTLTEGEVDTLFEEDFAHHYKIAQGTPGWQLANETGRGAMIDLAFNMGKWWTKWPKTSKLLGEGEFEAAGEEMLDSKWAKQVGSRAITVTDMIKMGEKNGAEIGSASMSAKVEVKAIPTTTTITSGEPTRTANNQSPSKKSGGSLKTNVIAVQEYYQDRLIQHGNA